MAVLPQANDAEEPTNEATRRIPPAGSTTSVSSADVPFSFTGQGNGIS